LFARHRYYHAFPFNSELELYSQTFLREGIQMTHELDSMLGLAPKATLSQRDVPGTTRSIIPILKSQVTTSLFQKKNKHLCSKKKEGNKPRREPRRKTKHKKSVTKNVEMKREKKKKEGDMENKEEMD
jgi:hypothetical protein